MDEKQIISRLNTEQAEAVRTAEGPLLILAGAGSGKTRVLVHRISYLINVLGVWPGSILAITFTNKAADEMKSRVEDLIGPDSGKIWVMTFHAACVRILRRHAEELGYTRYFTIYDSDDSLSVMKDIFKAKRIDTKRFREKQVLALISSAKNELVSPDRYAETAGKDFYSREVGSLYEEYQKRLLASNAMDFDDLIGKTIELFKRFPDILGLYQDKFRYLMVDEYQDTNTAQFSLISLLAEKYRNLCVVGDDDQSIYRFRGANIRNILNFEQIFPDAKVIRLEQNYRSTGNILEAANAVIRNNRGRKDKKLWTENEEGAQVRFRTFENGYEEADFAADEIRRSVSEGKASYRDYAVLYRTNAQSRLFEEKFIFRSIPYKLVGGVNFYARKEIKDLLAYLKTVNNAVDDLAVSRIVNVPKRGIGQTTMTKIQNFAYDGGLSLYDAAVRVGEISQISASAAGKVRSFTGFIERLREEAGQLSVSSLLKKVVEETGYKDMVKAQDDEETASDRLGNIEELVNKAVQYETQNENPTLSGFLEEVALIADIDSVSDGDDKVLLMTLHAAKGLEFPKVYMAGMEEGIFPGYMSINSEDALAAIEEERRLCYVGITRAEKLLTLMAARERMVRGNLERFPVSRFVREIPREMLESGKAPASRTRLSLPGSGPLGPAKAFAPSGKAAGGNAAFGRSFPGGRASGGLSGGGVSSVRKSANAPKPEAAKKTSAGAPSKGTLSYAVGDQVNHVKFGNGVVREIVDRKKDFEVAVDFPAWGTKRFLAAYANLKKVE
ncbi:MAG: UvrD-helicase domain-containing protein [Lachnospiraceae bacterium]|nr:UvrD-helicase domain-containing protein [Lachnospiraceae bacterium]